MVLSTTAMYFLRRLKKPRANKLFRLNSGGLTVIKMLYKLPMKYRNFICEECRITLQQLYDMDHDKIYDIVYERMCEIETDETPSDNSPLTEHCKMAEYIVTVLGNALAKEEGLWAIET